MSENAAASAHNGGLNRAKLYQLVLFPFNNGATNVYYILTSAYIAYYGGVLGLALVFASTMVTVMRLFDAVTDPIIGALIDKTNGKFGKFRPFMLIGNLIMIVSSFLLYFCTQLVPTTMMPVRYVLYVLFYAIYVIGYTFQTSVTRSGQTVLTNDPKQRPSVRKKMEAIKAQEAQREKGQPQREKGAPVFHRSRGGKKQKGGLER